MSKSPGELKGTDLNSKPSDPKPKIHAFGPKVQSPKPEVVGGGGEGGGEKGGTV